jgi:ribonucleotide monophosphatase NagD (HAD superfamily)
MFVACLVMAVMTSCGSSHENSPKGLAEAAVECLADKDYKGYMNLTNATDQQKEAMASMLEKVGQQAEQKGGMKSHEIVDEEIDEEKGTATVTVKILYENGEEEENKMKMVQKDGEWLLSADK